MGKRARKRTRVEVRTLTDEMVSQLPRPPALMSSDEEDVDGEAGSESDGDQQDFWDEDEEENESDHGLEQKVTEGPSQSASALGGAAGYFDGQSQPRKRKSRNSKASGSSSKKMEMSQLSLPNEREVREIIRGLPVTHPMEMARLNQLHVHRFPTWCWQLKNGFNLVLYGFGSKRWLLDYFACSLSELAKLDTEQMKKPCVMLIHGFSPALSIKQLVRQVAEKYIGISKFPGSSRSLDDQCEYIVNLTRASIHSTGQYGHDVNMHRDSMANARAELPHRYLDQHLFIVIHNIDGRTSRTYNVQNAMSILAMSPKIHFVVSVDHVHAPLLWDKRQAERFNWIWYDATTFARYDAEIVNTNGVVGSSSESTSARGAAYVLKSLTPNHRSVLQVLAQYQLSHSIGMDFQDLYNQCRDEMLVSSERTLRNLLIEFHDHQLVATRRSLDGKEILYICLPANIITEQILEAYPK